MKAKSVACLALVVAGSIPVASLPAQAAQLAPVSVGVSGSGSANDWPLYIASSEGFFQNDGLAVTLFGVPTTASILQQLAAGSLNIGMSTPFDSLRAIDEGAQATLLNLAVGKPPYEMFAKPSIHSMAQLKNKTVMLDAPKGDTHYYFPRMAAGEGLDPDSCDFIYAGASSIRLAALFSGSVDATILNPPFNFLAQAKGFNQLPVQVDFAKGMAFTGFVVNLNWGESHKLLVRNFIDAYGKSVAWFYQTAHREEAVSILLNKVRITHDQAVKTYDMYVKEMLFIRKGTIEKTDLQAQLDVLNKDGSLSGSTDFSRFYKPGLVGLPK